jgi:hypothetical protein
MLPLIFDLCSLQTLIYYILLMIKLSFRVSHVDVMDMMLVR